VSRPGPDGFDLGRLDHVLNSYLEGRPTGRELRTFAEGLRVLPPKRLARHRIRTLPEPGGPVHAARRGAMTSLCGRELESMLEFPRRRFPFESYGADAACGGCAEAAGLLHSRAG
jgi:hypothetical protein